MTIEGPADKGITLSGGGKAGVMHVHEGAKLVNLTITEGKAQIIGGGILAEGALVLDHTTVAGNEAGSTGGIHGDVITLINSTVTNNVARAQIDLGIAGGIGYNGTGGLTLINSVVSHNSPSGVARHGTFPFKKILTFDNSIIAKNGNQNCLEDIHSAFTGRNISSDDTCGGSALEVLVVDPLLGPLADNGGPTPTRALDRNSPAINATDCSTITVDQRYVARDSKCDIGPFEFVFTTVTVTINGSAQVDPKTGTAVLTGTAKCSRGETFDLAVDLTQDQRAKRVPTVGEGVEDASDRVRNDGAAVDRRARSGERSGVRDRGGCRVGSDGEHRSRRHPRLGVGRDQARLGEKVDGQQLPRHGGIRGSGIRSRSRRSRALTP